MHRSAGDVASKTKGARFIGGKGQSGSLTWVGFDGYVVTIHIQPVNDIGADELEGHGVASVDP